MNGSIDGVEQNKDDPQMSTQVNPCDQAARVIQRIWRKHVDVTIFKHLKTLISFRHQGDPRLMLKYVNPREAGMLDAAAGVYIRFRLGGTDFPPNIYYKIFTHHPVVDLCASSPRDYTHAKQKRAVPLQIHNKQPLVADDRSGWYRRVENNGWRLLSDKISFNGDPITQDTSSKKIDFQHCRLIRRQDFERKKKTRKIEWMKKMYDEGALHARTEHRESAMLVKNSVQGMMYTVEHHGTSSIRDCEVDELIEWTNALNFDEYITEWKHMGTSKSSMVGKDEHLVLSAHDPRLSIHCGEKIHLDLQLFYQKIVLNRRGGFCYENNGLFSWLLTQLGFQVDILAAQVRNRITRKYGPPFDHLVNMVTLDGQRWLCDVGYGTSFPLPLSLETETPQTQSHGVYRIRPDGDRFFVELKYQGEWLELYKFTLDPCQMEDFTAMCEYNQSSVSSIFFCKTLCTMLLPTGRITIMGRKLIIRNQASEDQPPEIRTDLSDEELTEILRERFGIVLSSPLTPKDIDIIPPPVDY